MMRSCIAYLLSLVLLSACGTMSYVGIETYNPAEVTFPKQVSKVLVVNNAVPQPVDLGYTYNVYGNVQDTCTARADSALFDASRTLGESIAKASFFNDVLIYHDGTREDEDFNVDRKLTMSRVNELCAETGADAVISVDRLLFNTQKNVAAFSEGYVVGTIDVKITGVIRSYIPGREAPLATVHVTDSLYLAESADNMFYLNLLLPPSDEALRMAGRMVGAKAYVNFVPYWNKETRWYYTSLNSRWKEASAYAAAEKWGLAKERWTGLFYGTKNWKTQAKSASNIALCNEMQGELIEAYDWAYKSYELFKKHGEDNDKNTNLLELYVKTLAERVRLDKKLNIQFGKD